MLLRSRLTACVRSYVTCPSTMSAWQIAKYGPDDESMLSQNPNVHVPILSRPNDVLIKVKAASLNPLDARMKEGYGRAVIGLMRQIDQWSLLPVDELPLTLGRDCSGEVVDVGQNVRRFKPGDQIWCANGAERQGCFAEYTLASADHVSLKPKNLSHVEAASMPYVACTVWAALCTAARLHKADRQQKLLIHAGSGGIGTFAIQLAKAYNAKVTTTCNRNAFDLVKTLGADNVVYYTDNNAYDQLIEHSPYDIILDPVNTTLSRKSADLLGLWRGAVRVSIANPMLSNSDQMGLPLGMFQSAVTFSTQFCQHASNGRLSIWAYVIPSGRVLDTVRELVETGKIKPVIQAVYPFDRLSEALERVSLQKGRGKLVLEMTL